jgi:hypothetical protein
MDHLLGLAVERLGRTAKYTQRFAPGSSPRAKIFSLHRPRSPCAGVGRRRWRRSGWRLTTARHPPRLHQRHGRTDVAARDECRRPAEEGVARRRAPPGKLDEHANGPPRWEEIERAVVRRREVACPVASVGSALDSRSGAEGLMASLRPIQLRAEAAECKAEADAFVRRVAAPGRLAGCGRSGSPQGRHEGENTREQGGGRHLYGYTVPEPPVPQPAASICAPPRNPFRGRRVPSVDQLHT